jgi:hypothetical protein
MSLGLGLGLPYRRTAGGGGGEDPYERVPNPTISGAGIPWTTEDAISIGAGQISWADSGIVTSSLDEIANGLPFDLVIDLTNVGRTVAVRLWNAGEVNSQTVYTGVATSGQLVLSGTTTNARDEIRITSNGAGLVITGVSLIA